MDPLAVELNAKIAAENPLALELLSELGKRMYFPSKGILSQSAEAKTLGKRFNASIGTALEAGQAMHLDCVMRQLDDFNANEALLYAPSQGIAELRQSWRQKNLHDNPDLQGVPCSLPIVTNGLSGALSVAADLFVNPGDSLLMANMNWDNYHLNFGVRCQAKLEFYNYFEGQGLDLQAFREALQKHQAGEKLVVILNFPNNPSGYTATEEEGEALAQALLQSAERGLNLVVLVDDAYFGLFFDSALMQQSMFSKLAGKHPRLLAIKADAATKEVYVWGLRVGFISFSIGGVSENSPLFAALEAKAAGIVRSTISNCSILSQKIINQALQDPGFYAQRQAKAALMKTRALKVKEVLANNPDWQEHFEAYPFSSGYFMCLRLKKIDAESLRLHLLQKYQAGTISITASDLRIAFSCLEEHEIPELFKTIYLACQDLD
ncbi:MAG: aminotransferase class I/II-fold pyridoxal phosphate-dependent enzyme [Lentisphaeria bacterium]|nr:aminotransferase class I/II-fold pyridoxal phosphate-dependent enzyme [Lentisphaeria bacterium]MDY0175383.1 aminotransferase class I/II-fold pyridoxal phosphate-dependent enzyme [Lentisphaeria bacterium]